MLSRDAAIRDIGEMSHLAVEGGQVVGAKLAEVRVASRTRQHGHQFRGGGKELVEPLRRVIEGEPSPKLRFFGRDPDRGIVQLACPHPDTTDRLHGRIGHRHRIRPQSQGLCEGGCAVRRPGRDLHFLHSSVSFGGYGPRTYTSSGPAWLATGKSRCCSVIR